MPSFFRHPAIPPRPTIVEGEDSREYVEGRRQRAEGRRQRAEGRRQRAEGRGQKAEGRRQKAEDRLKPILRTSKCNTTGYRHVSEKTKHKYSLY
jgi:hypothetical protein